MSEKKDTPAVTAAGDATVPVPNAGQVPDYIKAGGNRGGENVGVKDLALPRIQLAQSMSPAMKSSDAAYIDGIKEGDIYNTLTRENYGSEVVVVPVYFNPRYTCWRTRATGGGFRGSFVTEKEAAERVAVGTANGEQIEIVETHEHLLLVVTKDRVEQAILSMSRTQLKQSRKWNSLMRLTNRDIFATAYMLTSITESNQRGTYKNWNVAPIGFPSEATYKEAEALYTQVSTGAVNIVSSDEGTGGSTDY